MVGYNVFDDVNLDGFVKGGKGLGPWSLWMLIRLGTSYIGSKVNIKN